MRVDPETLNEFEKQGAIEAARGARIDIFDARRWPFGRTLKIDTDELGIEVSRS
jgi:hypothetical protein